MGGFVAAEVAIQFPERVSRLVLVSAAGISTADALQRPILPLGRVATAIATNTAARHRQLAAPPDHAAQLRSRWWRATRAC